MIIDSGKYYLYRHIRLDKNQPFYIGVGTKKSFIKNWNRPSAYYRAFERGDRNKIWWDIIDKTEYEIEVLLESDSEDFIFEKEIEFIKLYGRIDKGTGILANMTDGGKGARKLLISKSNRIKVSDRSKGNTYRRGTTLSEETKLMISQSMRGRKLLPESIEKRTKTRQSRGEWFSKESKEKIGKGNSKRLSRENLTTGEIEYYNSCHNAANKIGMSFQRIAALCKDSLEMKGYKWKYI